MITGVQQKIDLFDFPNPQGSDTWDTTGAVWDKTGTQPVIQGLFWAIENQQGTQLEALDSLRTLTDPDSCPPQFLPIMAQSLGVSLNTGLSESAQRMVLRGLGDFYKSRGTELSWTVWLRSNGFTSRIYPLWKKLLNAEDLNEYSRSEYVTNAVSGEVLGPSGLQTYVHVVRAMPVVPLTLVVTEAGQVWREVERGVLLSNAGGTGTFSYATGKLRLNSPVPTTSPPELSYETATDTFPYHAARVDLEVDLFPTTGNSPCNALPDVTDFIIDQPYISRITGLVDEVRPIHVKLRALGIVPTVEDELCNPVEDACACGPSQRVLDRSAYLYSSRYAEWDGADAAPVPDDGLSIYEDAPGTGGTTGGVLPGTSYVETDFEADSVALEGIADTLTIVVDGVTLYW
jgi:hypothetical protein